MLSKSLTVLLVVYFTSDFSFAFPMDYAHVNGLPGLYKFYATKKNWTDAKQVCAKEGASLFYPRDRIEAYVAIAFWKRYETHDNPAAIWIFVGISDIKTEGMFETIDGKPISEVYHGWYSTQPDNFGDEDCVHLNQEGSLNDIKCDAEYSFICEKKLSPAQNISIQPTSSDVEKKLSPAQNISIQPSGSVATEKDYAHVNGLPGVYKFYATKKNWTDAKQVCAEEGASLLYPRDRIEAYVAIAFWKRYETHDNPAAIWIFVGISDIKTEGVFETIDGKSISEVYHGWYSTQPDNFGDEDCVHLNQEGSLNDIKCDAEYSFICEKKLSPAQNISIQPTSSDVEKKLSPVQNISIQSSGLDVEKKLSPAQNISIQPSGLVATEKDYAHVNGLPGLYKFYATKKNWTDAKQVCAEEGASLFYPRDRIEAYVAIAFWKRYETHDNPAAVWIFVGISDIKTEGVFETIDGKSISEVYHGWYSTQPDNFGDEDCVHLNQEGSLNDIKCDAEYSFICEKKLSPAQNISIQSSGLDVEKKLSPAQNISIQSSGLDVENATEVQKAKDEQKIEDDQLTNKFFRPDYHYIEAVESFYKIHSVGLPYAEAKRVCAQEGATFWYPDNEDEILAVIALWDATQPIIQWLYVGLADMTENPFEGQLVSEEPIYESETNNNLPGYESDNRFQNQNCVYMYNNGYMDEHRCTDRDAFVCKKTLQSLERNSQYNMINTDYTFDEDIGKCYKLHTTPLSWNEAYAACQREQSHLAVIRNLLEAEYLANLTQSTPNPRVEENYQRGVYHVGFHNQFNEGWQTVTGFSMDADIWWDNYEPAEDRAQCGSMFYTGRLVNTDCTMKSYFICEHDFDSEKGKC